MSNSPATTTEHAEELRGMCDDLGLKVVGTHTGLNTLLGDELQKTVAFNQTLGNPYLIGAGVARTLSELAAGMA